MDNRYDRQRKLEEEALQMGIKAYREALAEDGLGAVSPGKRMMVSAIQPMSEAVKDYCEKALAGKPGRGTGVVYFVDQFEPDTVAYLTAQTVIGSLNERPSVAKVASRIGSILEQSMQIDEIAKGNKWLADKVAKLREKYNAKNQIVILRKIAQRNDATVVAWDDAVKARVGALLLEMFCQSTGLAAIDVVTKRESRAMFVRPTEVVREWLEREHAKCELLSPFRFPMLCKPRDWTNPRNGGYLTPKLKQPLVKTRNKHLLSDMASVEMPKVYAAVNALQGTEWAVNEAVYGVVKALWESSSTAGGLPSRDQAPLPAKAHDGTAPADDPRLLAWKREAAKVYEANAKAESKRLQLVQKLYVAERMIAEGNSFHFVYNMDWRGRLYPVASGLNPQGDDVAKALLRFANAVPLGDEGAYWLAVHGANCFGVDKVSFDERTAWVEEHEKLIVFAGRTGMTQFVMQADNPFQFLAFCVEYARLQDWVDEGKDQETFPSTLPVAFDGACNGLQNFSAMLRDEIGGAATGLVPDSKPSDIYTAVAQRAQALIDRAAADGEDVARKWIGKMTRKLAKRNTMTVPYGVSRYGMRDQLRQEFRKAAAEGDTFANSLTPEDAAFIAKVNYEAIGQVVVAARSAMDWLQEAAKVAASNGLPVRWTTPVGFLAVQDYREEEGYRVDFVALGRRFNFVIVREGSKLNTRKQAAGISPNFVHSLDAAHLMLTVLFCAEDGMRDFAMVHDSYGCHAGNAALLRDNLREAFVSQYEGNVLGNFRDQLVAQLPPEVAEKLPPVPAFGTLDLTAVRRSEYFFA